MKTARNQRSRTHRPLVLLLALLPTAALLLGGCGQPPRRNIILMISDGAGFNHYACGSYYQHGRLGAQAYDRFPVRLACSTYMVSAKPDVEGYDPSAAWADFGFLSGKSGYQPVTDSAAAATALLAGRKTQGGRINTYKRPDGTVERLTTIAELAKQRGLSVGTVSNVQFAHATPACVWAHNDSRGNYADIANEMLFDSGLDVIVGCGHPEVLDDGTACPEANREYKYVGGEQTWRRIRNGETGHGWACVESREEFGRVASMTPDRDGQAPPARLLGLLPCHKTTQFYRPGPRMAPPNEHVPDLATASLAAINVLARNERGFFVMIEGGAIDWAGHANNLERMVTEQVEFNEAVEAVVRWVEQYSSWDETLLIVTSDHETGWLWGPDSGPDGGGPDPFTLPVNAGRGNVPLAEFHSGGHSNALVPLFARGAGAERFFGRVRGDDPRYGRYVDNTDVFGLMSSALPGARPSNAELAGRPKRAATPTPAPAAK